MTSFTNQVVWVTGASSGIGEALAVALARAGARLVLSARRADELARVQRRTGLPDTHALLLPLDLLAPETFADAVARVLAHFGRVDMLVHNAGISQRGFARTTDLAVDRRLMEVNFFGTVALTKAVLPTMLAQRGGRLVVVTSVVGLIGSPMRSGYAASKHALHGYFDSLRAELWADNIRVTLACPGYIQTNISVNALNESGQAYQRMDQNQARGMPAEACAAAILRATAAGREEVVIGQGKEVLGPLLKRFFPALLSRILRQMVIK